MTLPNGTVAGLHQALSQCHFLLNRQLIRAWLPCALAAIQAWNATAATARRRLHSTTAPGPAAPVVVEQSGLTFQSNTAISYTYYYVPGPTSTTRSAPSPPSAQSSSAASYVIEIGVGAGVLAAMLLLCVLYTLYHHPKKEQASDGRGPATARSGTAAAYRL